MLSVTKMLGDASYFGDSLRYHSSASRHTTGVAPGSGPVVVWNATKTCNLECKHCYADAIRGAFPGELTTEEAFALVDDLASIKTPALLLSGGEPLVRRDILDVARYAMNAGIRITFSTNGTLIDKKMAKALADIGLSYAGISIDGSEETHDKFRGRKGAYRDALRGIRNAREAGIRVGVRFTVTTDNASDIESVYRLVEEEGIGRLCIYHLVYSGRGSYMKNHDLELNEKRAFIRTLLEKAEQWTQQGRDIEVLTVDNHADAPFIYYWLLERDNERAQRAFELLSKNGGNRSGIAIGAIDSFGNVHPDQFTSHKIIGNIRDRKFSEIWSDTENEFLNDLRRRKELLTGRCASCKWLSVCNGNFRARAEAATGSYWASDPACYLTDEEIAQ